MRERLRAHMTFANVVSLAALFIALGGTATAVTYVVSSNTQIAPNTVSGHAPPTGKHSNLIPESVNGRDVADSSLRGADILESTLGRVRSARLGGFGRSGSVVTCNPEGSAFTSCAGTEILNVPSGARALVLARARAFVEGDSSAGDGTCRLTASSLGAVPGSDMSFSVSDSANSSENGTLAAITPPLPAGATSFGIECNDQAPIVGLGTEYREVAASAVLISDA
jgi:hypothetical protein